MSVKCKMTIFLGKKNVLTIHSYVTHTDLVLVPKWTEIVENIAIHLSLFFQKLKIDMFDTLYLDNMVHFPK